MLSYQKLDVYRCAREFLSVSQSIIQQIPRGHNNLADELKRASLSIQLNIAEGSGKTGKLDRERFLGIARGSAMECGSVLDACETYSLANPVLLRRGHELVTRIVSMLSKMIKL